MTYRAEGTDGLRVVRDEVASGPTMDVFMVGWPSDVWMEVQYRRRRLSEVESQLENFHRCVLEYQCHWVEDEAGDDPDRKSP